MVSHMSHLMHVCAFVQPNFVVPSEDIVLHITAIRKTAGEHVQVGLFSATYSQERQEHVLPAECSDQRSLPGSLGAPGNRLR